MRRRGGSYMENLKKYLAVIDEVIEKGRYKDNWHSLRNHKVPEWYQKAKFGIFIHWGPYSVPAFGSEWYARFMYKPNAYRKGKDMHEHHLNTFGAHKDFGYKDFIPLFKAEKFDPNAWAELFETAGARFVMPVAEHHDGFQMYESDLSEWCATKKGPMRDIVGELKMAVEARNMVLTASSHRVEHYWFMHGGREMESDFPEEIPYGHLYWPSYKEPFKDNDLHDIYVENIDPLFMEDWLARTCEIVDRYRPKIMYFDWWIEIESMKPYLKKFMAYYYNRAEEWGEEVTINYKNDAFIHTSGVRDVERGQLSDVSPYFWQTDTAVAKNSWCYTEGNDYKKSEDLLRDLIDIVSKNGSLLLNIGPKADGTIPEEDATILKEIGAWLKVNGEGIYETEAFRKYGEGPTLIKEGHHTELLNKPYTTEDLRFTYKEDKLYVFALKYPEDGVIRMHSLGTKSPVFNAAIRGVTILGQDTEAKYILTADSLTVFGEARKEKNPVCIVVQID